jgi:hypothetical protein
MEVGLVGIETNRWSDYEDDMCYGYTALGAVLVLHACPLSLRYQKEAVHFTKTLHRQRRRRGLGIALQFDHTAATGLATRQRLGSGGRLAIHMALYTCQGER